MVLALLLGCGGLGVIARRWSGLPAEAVRVLNLWVLYVSLPALVLKTVHGVKLEARCLVAAGVLWALFFVTAALATLAVRRGWATREVAGALALSAGLGNTAFIGLPLIEALGGPAAVPSAAIIDQLGSFLVFAVGAVPFAMIFGGQRVSPGLIARRLVTFPPLIGLVVALGTTALPYPAEVSQMLTRLADMLTPLALASVGWQLELRGLRSHGVALALGLFWKLLVAPAAMFAVMVALGGPFALTEQVAVAQAAMAPMITASVLAQEYRLAAPLSAAMSAVGALLSFATVPLWWALAGSMTS